jgi:hypothetical protein
LLIPDVGQFHEHGQVDAGDDLHLAFLQERQGEIGWGPPQHVGEDDHPVAVIHLGQAALDLLAGDLRGRAGVQGHGRDALLPPQDQVPDAQQSLGQFLVSDD